MARRLDLNTPRPLQIIELDQGFACMVYDTEECHRLSKQIMKMHLAMMLVFITVCFAIFAWIAALLNILLSPKVALRHFNSSNEKLTLSRIYFRKDPSIKEVQSPVSIGPEVLGRGTPEPPIELLYGDMHSIEWTEYSLRFQMLDGTIHDVLMEVTSSQDIARLGQRIDAVRQQHSSSIRQSLPHNENTVTREQNIPIEKLVDPSHLPPEPVVQPKIEGITESMDSRDSFQKMALQADISIEQLIDKLHGDVSPLSANNTIDKYNGHAFTFTLNIAKKTKTFAFQLADQYRQGQTLIGTIDALEVIVYYPTDRNEEILSLSIGADVSIVAVLHEWKQLQQQVVFWAQ